MTPIMKNICFKRLLLEIFSTISFSKEGQRIHECVTLQVRWHKYFCSSISNFIYNSRQILFWGGDDLDSSCWNTKLESELILKVCVCITFLSLIHLEQKIRSKLFTAQYVPINLSLGMIYSYFSVYCISFPKISHCKTIHHTLYTIKSFQTNASPILILKKLNAQSVLMIRSNTNNTVIHRSRHLLFTGFCLVWKRISS